MARAGKHGKGFVVVTDTISNMEEALNDHTKDAGAVSEAAYMLQVEPITNHIKSQPYTK